MKKSFSKGFSLIEVMIALALVSIVMATMFVAFRSQERNYQSQEERVDLQQSMRAGLTVIADDIRMAGYNASRNNNLDIDFNRFQLGFTLAQPTSFSISMLFEDGEIEMGDIFSVNYYLDQNTNDPNYNDLIRADSSDPNPVALIEYIRGGRLCFLYTLQDGTGPFSTVTGDLLDQIVKVDVYIVAEKPDRPGGGMDYIQSYQVPDGNGAGGMMTWNVTGRHLFARQTIYCRNMVYKQEM